MVPASNGRKKKSASHKSAQAKPPRSKGHTKPAKQTVLSALPKPKTSPRDRVEKLKQKNPEEPKSQADSKSAPEDTRSKVPSRPNTPSPRNLDSGSPNHAHHTDNSTLGDHRPSSPPLAHQWVFWEHRGFPKGGGHGGHDSAYHHAIGYLGECSTVGEFWSIFNNIPQPSQFFAAPPQRWPRPLIGSRHVEGWSLFRHGVQPEWEDPQNATGAELQFSTGSLEQVDQWWHECALTLIGNLAPESEHITGMRVIDKCKKGSQPVYRVEIWFTEHLDNKLLIDTLTDVLSQNGETAPSKFSLKQHSKQKPLAKAAAKAAAAPSQHLEQGRIREIRALLAKLTPDRFDRLAPQLRGLLGDGTVGTVQAVVQCIHQCTMQTDIFHSMYADLVLALNKVAGVSHGVIRSCLDQLRLRSEEDRQEAKKAASFTAELCSRELIDAEQIKEVLGSFEAGMVEVEVLCALLTKLLPIKVVRVHLKESLDALEAVFESGVLPPRLRFLVQDTLKLSL